MKTPNAIALLIDSNRGIYVPQTFGTNFSIAQTFRTNFYTSWEGITEDDRQTLQNGPDDEFYWEAWDQVLNNAKWTCNGYTWRLHQDGDVWAVCYELMSDEEKANFGMEGD